MKTITSTNPSKGYAEIGQVDVSTESEIVAAVASARKALAEWSAFSAQERAEFFKDLAKVTEERKDEIARLITAEMGKPSSDAVDEVEETISALEWMVSNAANVLDPQTIREDATSSIEKHHEPYGVAAAIAAWNFPFSNFKECALQDLIAGNTIVFKHSEENPLVGKLIDELMKEAGFPEGVFSQVYGAGEVGEILTNQNIDFISFIGSSKVGRALYKKAAEKFINVRLEMGGSSPGIVFEDVDVKATAKQVVSDRFFNSGQVCDALKRLIVQDSIYDQFIATVKNEIEALKFGDPDNEDTSVSSLVAERQVQPMLDQINRSVAAGATILLGGKKPKVLMVHLLSRRLLLTYPKKCQSGQKKSLVRFYQL